MFQNKVISKFDVYGRFILFMYNPNNGWLEWPSTHQGTIQKIPFWDFMDGMKLSPGVSLLGQYFIFFFWSFFSQLDFFFLGTIFLSLFFFPHPWPQVFFGKLLPTHNLPTALLPTNPPTSLILQTPPYPPPFALTYIARGRDNLSSSKLQDKLRNMETQGKRSFNMMAEVGAWRWTPFSSFFSIFCVFFFAAKNMMTTPSSFSFVLFFCYEEDDDNIIAIFFLMCVFFATKKMMTTLSSSS
jgi:hypothetical protein